MTTPAGSQTKDSFEVIAVCLVDRNQNYVHLTTVVSTLRNDPATLRYEREIGVAAQ